MGSTFVPPQVFPPESGASLAQGKDHEMTDVHSRSTGGDIKDPLSKPDEGAHGDDSKTATPSQTSNILTQMQHPSQRLTREPPVTYDLLTRFKNTFRILDLISEQGSGGLVEKIIIDQASFEAFVNVVRPGAYTSMTKVDFKSLDALSVQSKGVYGSKESLVELMLSVGAIDEQLARELLSGRDPSRSALLRSGLYLIRLPASGVNEQILVVYWPEETTWNDDAISSVKRNRVTFMRYLTKITDHIVCLISEEHGKKLVLDVGGDDDDDMDIDKDDDGDRMFAFEVSKTNEQDENVVLYKGFDVHAQEIRPNDLPEALTRSDYFMEKPRLVNGETSQALLTARYIPPAEKRDTFRDKSYSKIRLSTLLAENVIELDVDISNEAINVLVENGLAQRHAQICLQWKDDLRTASRERDQFIAEQEATAKQAIWYELPIIERAIEAAVVRRVVDAYPTLEPELSVSADHENDMDVDITEPREGPELPSSSELEEQFAKLVKINPDFSQDFEAEVGSDKLKISNYAYRKRRERFALSSLILDHAPTLRGKEFEESLLELIKAVHPSHSSTTLSSFSNALKGWIGLSQGSNDNSESIATDARRIARSAEEDGAYLISAAEAVQKHPILAIHFERLRDETLDEQRKFIQRITQKLTRRAESRQQSSSSTHIKRQADIERDNKVRAARERFTSNFRESQSDRVFFIRDVTTSGAAWREFKVTGETRDMSAAKIEYTLHPLRLDEHDRQELQMNATHSPKPRIKSQLSGTFCLPTGASVLYIHSLAGGRILLLVKTHNGSIAIYLEELHTLENAVMNERQRKMISRDKIKSNVLIAYDEASRILVLCASENLVLHIFQFDEVHKSLQSWGSSTDLTPWYPNHVGITMTHMTIVAGSQEILLVDSTGQARIFSLITQQFRPAMISLDRQPSQVFSSPDGACLMLLHPGDDIGRPHTMRAYHWASFGSTEGIALEINLDVDSLVLTSFVNRTTVHLLSLNVKERQFSSVAFNITKKATEFMFKEKGGGLTAQNLESSTFHNCLIDCHVNVWTRFPVAAAVTHRGICQKLSFGTNFHSGDSMKMYFSNMVYAFEMQTRKPTGSELKNITVQTWRPDEALGMCTSLGEWAEASVPAGEWLVDILCLIPIHIAVARENRFIPLKDGVSSSELEKSLLGAEVGAIIDILSLGWYESIFQSYMSQRPVKVVSSMGEQSVGKSYMLNHLVDSSFAGSAMRTTEGIWMAVTPTADTLIVALDFEGVHSIERSAQEDTLLVLFNCAISNLVLFRNNFALSRDIAGLFQSFQSSSSVLDPTANPSLFQSTLAIIIKDVVESDKKEIVREFTLKFQSIVQDEQAENFISRLHAGKLNIIPWPVIESKQFYTLFPALKKRLDQQKVTHSAAGEFLLTLKTLMAKLKANDWGSMSQTLIAHRAQKLLGMLDIALSRGVAEMEPEKEKLKNLDTDEVISENDTSAFFCLASSGESNQRRESHLVAFREAWEAETPRSSQSELDWTADFTAHLESLADLRIVHVRQWIQSNLERFTSQHANVQVLYRALENAVVDMKLNLEICKQKCSTCFRSCMRSRRHDLESSHDCCTDHSCHFDCEYENHAEDRPVCGMRAGHSGRHICAVDVHLCGQTCVLKDKSGCMSSCTKSVDHDGDHLCSAKVHACGEPCQLHDVLNDGKRYSCSGMCSHDSDEDHIMHTCDNRMCPIKCQLCKRLCGEDDHLHALNTDAVHLCGQEHSCSSLCAANGICEIDTTPQSIQATFTGRHESFQYTKYTQDSKRLPCAKSIPAGILGHHGPHSHSLDEDPFHYCETRCENCGYFCTLPRGHAQQEHETSHGSMSRTKWSVEGPEGATVELNGHQFGNEDDGAPMMCSMVCKEFVMGRHAHLGFCRSDDPRNCGSTDISHLTTRLNPEPSKPKDWITHKLYWMRLGFKDPYSRDDQANFARCDSLCPGPEHATGGPSYCTLPMFHPPASATQAVGLGYRSQDGHIFSCTNPTVLQQAFHVIFVVDRSGSMAGTDRRPLTNTPVSAQIAGRANNRLGAVYSALHAFWQSRATAVSASGTASSNRNQAAAGVRRDAYSVILFDHAVYNCVANDFNSTPQDLLNMVLRYSDGGGTNFDAALTSAKSVMESHWSSERTPVVIFLSDGECSVSDEKIQDLSRSATARGKPLSFHSVSFGPRNEVLRRMAQIALQVQNSAPAAAGNGAAVAAPRIDSSYSEALDSVRLAETFLGFAEALKKPRGSLMT